MDGRPAWTDCDKAGDYVVSNVFSPRDLVSRPDNMDETVPHTTKIIWKEKTTQKLTTKQATQRTRTEVESWNGQ